MDSCTNVGTQARSYVDMHLGTNAHSPASPVHQERKYDLPSSEAHGSRAGRSLQTSGLRGNPREDQEVSSPAEERGGRGRSRARSQWLKCGKYLGEEELLEKEAGLGRGGATGGAGRG